MLLHYSEPRDDAPAVTVQLFETVRVLVSAGADRNAADEDGITPLDEARAISDPELQGILDEHTA